MKINKNFATIISFILSIYASTCLFIFGGSIIIFNNYSVRTYGAFLSELNIFKIDFYTSMLQILFFIILVFPIFYFFLKKTRFLYFALIQSSISTILYMIFFILAASWYSYPPIGSLVRIALAYFIVSFAFYFFFHYLKKLFAKLV